MAIKPTSPIGVALSGAQTILTSPTARKLLGEATKAAVDIGTQVAREQVPGLLRRISSQAAGPRGAAPGSARDSASTRTDSPQGRALTALKTRAGVLQTDAREQLRPLRQQAMSSVGHGLQDALLAATQQRSASAGVQMMGEKLGTIGSQLGRDAQPIATQFVARAATELASAAREAFSKTPVPDAATEPASTHQPDPVSTTDKPAKSNADDTDLSNDS